MINKLKGVDAEDLKDKFKFYAKRNATKYRSKEEAGEKSRTARHGKGYEMKLAEETENLLQSIIDQKPLDTKTHFDNIMKDRLADMLDVYKNHIAADAFDGGEKSPAEPDSETPTEEPEEDLSDEEIEKIISDLSDEDLETLIKDIDNAEPEEGESETGDIDDAGVVDDTTPKEEDDETELAEGDRFKAAVSGVRAYREKRREQKDEYYKSLPSRGKVTKISRGSALHEKFDFSKFKKKGKDKDKDKDDDDDKDEKSSCEKKCEAKEKDKD